jgi:hypothetical protein
MISRDLPSADDGAGIGLAALAPEPPLWAAEVSRSSPPASLADLDRWRLVQTAIPDCAALDAATLQQAVTDAYAVLRQGLEASGHFPVRFWNFVPGIHADMGGGRDRYMVFNAGRFAAFERWFGQAAVFTRTIPTASAVGIGAGALTIYALAAREAGLPVELPRHFHSYLF